jgi:hypothetical protein
MSRNFGWTPATALGKMRVQSAVSQESVNRSKCGTSFSMQSCRRQLNLRLSCVIRPSINIAHGNSMRSLLANKTEVFHLTPRFLLASKRLEKRSSCLKKARSCGTLRRSLSERPSRNCVEGRLGTPGRHAGRDARSRPWSRDVSLGSMRVRRVGATAAGQVAWRNGTRRRVL